MNAFVSPYFLANQARNEIIERQDGSVDFAISPQLSCHYNRPTAALWSRWAPRGIPSFNIELLHDLERGSQLMESYFCRDESNHPLSYIVLRSAASGAFNVGGDLGYFQNLICRQDRAGLTEYARAATNVQYRNYTSHNLKGVTTVALLEGDALGGGLECALSCDVVIAERHVKAGFPEVLFNMFPGMGGISLLARRTGRKVSDEMTRTGRQYTALELLELGVIDEVVETGDGVEAVHRLIRRREHQQDAHTCMNTVDRLVRPLSIQEMHEVSRVWVDCALRLSPRSLEWMQRLYHRQIAIFGRQVLGSAEIDAFHASTSRVDAVAAAA